MYQCRVISDLGALSPAAWTDLNHADNPFISYAFLAGLEQHACLRAQCWQPSHIVIEKNRQLLGFMPLYIKQDSYGEFVFDQAWADAYQHAGRQYYPKLVSAVPFSPVSGPRLLVHKRADRADMENRLLKAACNLMHDQGFSSLHLLFPDHNAAETAGQQAGLTRLSCGFHWLNQNYEKFQAFTHRLSSKKRKQIQRERRAIGQSGIRIECLQGREITAAHWQVFYDFYCLTFYRKWSEPRLTLDFFMALGDTLPDQTLLFLAREKDDYIAGAFAMRDNETIYGRHWGCRKAVPYLHFELCYYQTIDYAIRHRLKKLDAGVQGEHKLARGFEPVAMPSSHWMREPDFNNAIRDYLGRETPAMQDYIKTLKQHSPYKHTDP